MTKEEILNYYSGFYNLRGAIYAFLRDINQAIVDEGVDTGKIAYIEYDFDPLCKDGDPRFEVSGQYVVPCMCGSCEDSFYSSYPVRYLWMPFDDVVAEIREIRRKKQEEEDKKYQKILEEKKAKRLEERKKLYEELKEEFKNAS